MDEEKLKKIRARIKYLRKIGKNQKADQLANKITKVNAKKEYKKERGKTGVGSFIKKVSSGVKNAAKTVANEVKETADTVKKVKEMKKSKKY